MRLSRLEPLEERTLLSIGEIGVEQESLLQRSTFESALLADLTLEASIDQVPTLHAVSSPWVDEGDYYWADGRQIPLWRATDEVVVGLAPEADVGLLFAQLAAVTGSLA